MLWSRGLPLTINLQVLRRIQNGQKRSTTAPQTWHGLLARKLHVAPILMPPVIFAGLLVALWCWKCTMLIMLQNTIIYNPYLPPNARKMKISDYARYCRGIHWREERIRSLDGTEISLCISNGCSSTGTRAKDTISDCVRTPVYILYFQGNASSLPPRLPDLSSVLTRLQLEDDLFRYTLIGVSYRGYWTSHDRPSETGINKDTNAALRWMSDQHYHRSQEGEQPTPVVIFWGQSVGCGFATNLAAWASSSPSPTNLPINALVLETPFTNTRDMLSALYPQKWLPYKHLWPFLRSHLDSWKNLESIGNGYAGIRPPNIYIVEAGKDELVPLDHGKRLQKQSESVGLQVQRHTVRSALHNDVMARPKGREAIVRSILSAARKAVENRNEETNTTR